MLFLKNITQIEPNTNLIRSKSVFRVKPARNCGHKKIFSKEHPFSKGESYCKIRKTDLKFRTIQD
jgi:hypothetical protein